MKQLARHLIRIYPAAWRVRYAEEMEALLEQMELSATDILDLLFGATYCLGQRRRTSTA